jgi:hypothetical protein
MASRWKRMRDRYGLLQPALLIGSTIGVFLITASLISLWNWDFHSDPNSLRSIIARRGQTDAVITVCCAALRTFMAVQVSVCCMMLATLAFEHGCVLLRDAAAVSIYRYATASPWALAFPLFRGTLVSKNFATVLLTTVLSLVTILSQLLSTVLLLDLESDLIVGKMRNSTLHYADDNVFWSGALKYAPLAFPRFAERTGNMYALNFTGPEPGLAGIGPTVRAFVPIISQADRESLVYYQGVVGLVEAHVLCVSPELKNITFESPDRVSGQLSINYLHQPEPSGKLKAENSFQWNADQPLADMNFDCTIDNEGGWALCPLRPPETLDCPGFPTSCLFAPTNEWFLVINQRSPSRDSVVLGQLYNVTDYKFNGSEWTTKSINWGASNYEAELSLCIAGTQNTVANATAKADTTDAEPKNGAFMPRFSDVDMGANNTESIRKQLGSDRDFNGRGILNLTEYSLKDSANKTFTTLLSTLAENRSVISPEDVDRTYNGSILVWNFADIYHELFDHVLDTTSISAALQVLFTTVTAQAFYMILADSADTLDDLVIENPSALVQTAQWVPVPTKKRGLFIVCGLVGLHLTAMITVFWMFFTCRAPTFLSQAWHTISQLHSGETTGEFLRAQATSALGDREIARMPEAQTVVKLGITDIIRRGQGIYVPSLNQNLCVRAN